MNLEQATRHLANWKWWVLTMPITFLLVYLYLGHGLNGALAMVTSGLWATVVSIHVVKDDDDE